MSSTIVRRTEVVGNVNVKIEVTMEEKLFPIVGEILREQSFPDDDGMTDVIIMQRTGCSTEEFVEAERVIDILQNLFTSKLGG